MSVFLEMLVIVFVVSFQCSSSWQPFSWGALSFPLQRPAPTLYRKWVWLWSCDPFRLADSANYTGLLFDELELFLGPFWPWLWSHDCHVPSALPPADAWRHRHMISAIVHMTCSQQLIHTSGDVMVMSSSLYLEFSTASSLSFTRMASFSLKEAWVSAMFCSSLPNSSIFSSHWLFSLL